MKDGIVEGLEGEWVEAHNEREKIGEGRHQRVVVKRERLPSKR